MVYCESCGASNPGDAQQCFACHRSLTDAEPTEEPPKQRPTTNENEIEHPAIPEERYKILACVGTGGFGAVYKARAIQDNNRLVAIKEIRLRNLKPQEIIEATDTFNREVQILSLLSHPNLPRIYTHFTNTDHWYLVMDFIEGQTLETYLQANGGKLALDEVLAIGAQLCDVLSYLHTREPAIIFRDLKPANVMLSVYRQVYLIDFGSARFFKPGRPKDTIAFGSPGYAAPEQYGKAQTTPRSDLYSLGALLHQMLTGLDPAESSFQFKPVRKCIANVPDELDQLIMRMLEPEADKRPDSAAEVKTVLERHTAGSWRRLYEQPGTLSSPIYQPRDSFGQPPPDSWATSKPTLAQVQKQLGIPVTPSLASSTSSGNKISRRAVTGAVVALGIAGSVGLLSFAKFPMGHQHKHDAPSSQRQEIGHTYRVYKGHKGSVSSIVWSYMASGKLLAGIQAGGPYIASASFDHTVQVWDASGHRITKMTVHRAPVRALACSPDGRLMASADERACYVWNPLTGRIYLTHILPAGASPISSLSWSPDGQYLAIAADRVYIYQITLQEVEAKATAQIMNIYQGHKGPVTGILWSAYASDDVVTGGADGSIQIWTSEAGQRKDMNVLAQGRPIQALGHLPFPPTTIIFAYDTKILVWDCLKNTLVSTYTGHADTVTALAASPTSKQIASASLDGTVHVWDSLSGKPLFIYRKHTGPVRTVTWRPNDDTIASGGDDRTVRIWQG